jgi:hypothetical protein
VRSEQRSQEAKGAQPTGAGRHRAICFVARSVEYPCGYTSSLASRTWPGGAPAKTGSYFCTDPYRSVYNGHVFFRDLRVSTIRAALEIPYTVDIYTYEHGCQGWLEVHSGWAGEFDVAGQKWRLSVADKLDGMIGDEDTLYLERSQPRKAERMLAVSPVPQTLFLDCHAFNLGFSFKPGATGAVLEAVFTETNLPLGKLSIAAQGCSYLRLTNERVAAVLDASAGTASLPAGIYRIADCLVGHASGLFREPAFIRCDGTLAIQTGQTTSLELGPPLRNTVQVTRERNLLRLTYQLLGKAGEQYEYYNWRDRPRFSVLLILGVMEWHHSGSAQLQSTFEGYRVAVVLSSAVSLPYFVYFWFVLLATRSPIYRDRLARAFGVTGLTPEPSANPPSPVPIVACQ